MRLVGRLLAQMLCLRSFAKRSQMSLTSTSRPLSLRKTPSTLAFIHSFIHSLTHTPHRDKLDQKESELDVREQELAQVRGELTDALRTQKKSELVVLELKESLARHVLDRKTSELTGVAHGLQITVRAYVSLW